MRQRFSERYGFKTPRESFQIQNIDDTLKNRIWNYIYNNELVLLEERTLLSTNGRKIASKIYDGFFKTHEKPDNYFPYFEADMKKRYFALSWYAIYDLIEFFYDINSGQLNTKYIQDINSLLEQEQSGYRLIDGLIAPIIDEVEIKEIEDALNDSNTPVKRHLSNALELMSDRETPDYINSIKESISALESLLQQITGQTNSPLGSCINLIPFPLNEHFKKALRSLYSWTSTADGIRHATTQEEISSSFEEAKYMLVLCSAFVNYLSQKANARQ